MKLEIRKNYKQIGWINANYEVIAIGQSSYFGTITFEDSRTQDRVYSMEDSFKFLPNKDIVKQLN